MGSQHYAPGDARLTMIADTARDLVLDLPELWLIVGSQEDLLQALHAAGQTELNKATMRWRLNRLVETLKSWSPTRGPMVYRADVATLAQWLRGHPAYCNALLAALVEAADERTATMDEATS